MVTRILIALAIALGLANVPTVAPAFASVQSEELMTWSEFHAESYAEHADAFTAMFNSYEVKRSKNGRTMIRQGDSGSFKFVARAK